MTAVTISFDRVFGPLFVPKEESLSSEEGPGYVAVLEELFPQFHKRAYGWKLSIEELEYLRVSGSAHNLSVVMESDAVSRLQNQLRAECWQACQLYRILTEQFHYKLRHGGQFGALFIGYRDVRSHGECLFFLGPLHPLEAVAAARVAYSVGKRAFECVAGPSVQVNEIQNRSSSAATSPLKRRRV